MWAALTPTELSSAQTKTSPLFEGQVSLGIQVPRWKRSFVHTYSVGWLDTAGETAIEHAGSAEIIKGDIGC